MSNLPPTGYPARQHPPPHQHHAPHHQPYYAPPHQQQPPPPPGPPPQQQPLPLGPPPQQQPQQPGPPPGMYQAQSPPQQQYYGAPPMGGPPQQAPPGGYYPPQYAQQPQQPQQPPPGYAQPYGQPPQYYPQQPAGNYAPNGGSNFPPVSQPMQYQQPPPGSYPMTSQPSYSQGGNYGPPPPASQSGHGGQYPPTSMGGNYSQQPPPYNQNNSTYGQQPYPHHQQSGMNCASQYTQQQQPSMYTAQSFGSAANTSMGGSISGQGAMNGSGALMHNLSYPEASAPNLSPQSSLQQLCPSGLPLIEGDTCRAPIKLRVEEKIMEASGDSFYVTDQRKKVLYNVDGSRTPDQHKILKSAKGKPLLQMHQFSTVAKKIVISNMNGEPIATLRKQRVDSNTHKRIDATLHQTTHNGTRDIGKFIVAGNAQASSFKAENCREVVVAEISRAARSMKKIFSGQDSYTADVSAGSPAFMVMVVVAIDEMYADG